MEQLELVFKGVLLTDLEKLLSELAILESNNLQDSHFYINDQDMQYFERLNFFEYYSTPATCMIKSRYAKVGLSVQEAVTIISGCSPSVEVVLNFNAITPNGQVKICDWMRTKVDLAEQIIFGIEPVETEEEIIYVV